MYTDQKNRDDVRKGYLLPVEMWVPYEVLRDPLNLGISRSRTGSWWSVSQSKSDSYTWSDCRTFGGSVQYRHKDKSVCMSRTQKTRISVSRSRHEY